MHHNFVHFVTFNNTTVTETSGMLASSFSSSLLMNPVLAEPSADFSCQNILDSLQSIVLPLLEKHCYFDRLIVQKNPPVPVLALS